MCGDEISSGQQQGEAHQELWEPPLPAITAEQVRIAIMILATTKGVGTDRWHPAAWLNLPEQAL